MPRHTEPPTPSMKRFLRELGKRFADTRRRKDLTQEQLAGRLGVNTRHYQSLEAGQVVGLRLYWSAAEALGVPFEKLMKGLGPGGK